MTCKFTTLCLAVAGALTLTLAATSAHAEILHTYDSVDGQPSAGYTVDRYDTSAFESAFFDGDDRLHIQVSEDDSAANRPSGYSSTFYNNQGRKYNTTGENSFSIELYVGADWDTVDRSTGIWATAVDDTNTISGYPIISYRNIEAGGTFDEVDSGFYFYTQDVDLDENTVDPNYTMMADLDTGDFGQWYTLSFEIVGDVFEAMVTNEGGAVMGTYTDTFTYGSTSFANMIINTYNVGETYDVYYDNFSATSNVPEPATLALCGLGCVVGGLVYRRRSA